MIPWTGDGFIAAWLRFRFKCLPEEIRGGDYPERERARLKQKSNPLKIRSFWFFRNRGKIYSNPGP